jgi:hypothetical protein
MANKGLLVEEQYESEIEAARGRDRTDHCR